MNRHSFHRLTQSAVGLLLLSGTACSAIPGERGGIRLDHTRVIFNATDKMQTLTVKNRSDNVWLIQSRVVMSTQSLQPAPFLITPPLYRLGAGTEQTLRIIPQSHVLPEDKESLLYLSIQAIPASQKQSSAALQAAVSIRFNLKMFYRPAQLGEPPANYSCELRFSQHHRQIRVENPTPWHITLRTLSLGGKPRDLNMQPLMLAPQSVQLIPDSASKVRWQAVNDFGGLHRACQSAVRPFTES